MIEVFDIETYAHCYSHTGIDIETNLVYTFVIHKNKNQLLEYLTHLRRVKWQIGYNNLNFDAQVQQFIINSADKWSDLDGDQIAQLISQYATKCSKSKFGSWPDYPEWDLSIKQIDLFKVWHFDSKVKMTALKWIEFSIDMNNIEETPFPFDSEVSIDQIQQILAYNLHDVQATLILYNITRGNTDNILYKGINKLKLRNDIQSQFELKCVNWSDVRIGDELNKLSYCKLSGIDKKKIPKTTVTESFKFKDCFPSYYKFETDYFNNFVNSLADIEVQLDKMQAFDFNYQDTKYTIAKGGIHSNEEGRLIITKDNQILRDADIGLKWSN